MIKTHAVKTRRIDIFCMLVIILFILMPDSSSANSEEEQNKRPKIALVLSGGGARGIAHIGVIKTLEKLNIPVDIIVGTSMGSIIGGLYASGMSTDELTSLIDIDWSSVFKDDPEREEKRYRIKKDDHKYILKFGIGFKKGKLILPKGLILGQKQNMLLKGLTYDLYETDNFDDFPIQFRAVASDIETGNPVILSSGKLADAIRASMSVPGVFAPVEIDGKMLVDGGITNNIPINVAKDLGADVIIAVDVGTPFDAGGEVSNILNIAGQLSTFLVRKNSQEQIKKFKKEYNVTSEKALGKSKGILLQPELGDIGSADFERGQEALDIGIETAMKQKEKLIFFSLSEKEHQAFLAKQRKPAIPTIKLDFIDIDNHSRLSPNVIRSIIKLEEGDVLDIKKLEEDISRIYGLDIFERVEYNIVKRGDQTGLVIETIEKSWGPNYINFGYNFYTTLNGNNEYNIGINLTRNPLNRYGGEWKNEFQFGEKDRIYSELYQPFNRYMNYFIAPFVEFEREDIDIYNDGDNIAKLRSRTYTAGIDIGRQFGNWGSLRVGAKRTDGRTEVKIGNSGFDTYNYDRGGISSKFAYDTYDNYIFPNKGIKGNISVDIDMESMGADESIESYSFIISGAKTWGRYTFIPGIDVSTVSDDDVSVQYATRTGGFLDLSGFIPNELMGLHSGVGRMVFLRKMGKISNNPLYLGGSLEYGNVWGHSDDISLDSGLFAGSAFLGKDTLLGPIYIAYGIAEGGNRSFYISMGQPF